MRSRPGGLEPPTSALDHFVRACRVQRETFVPGVPDVPDVSAVRCQLRRQICRERLPTVRSATMGYDVGGRGA
jgi:hypothetical protein